MNIPYILKNLRLDAGLTQHELAQLLQIGQSTIVCYERGEREPTITNLLKYASYFNVSIDYLVCRTDDFGTPIEPPQEGFHLSPEERKLVEDYRGLGKPLKELLQNMIRSWQEGTRSDSVKDNEKR